MSDFYLEVNGLRYQGFTDVNVVKSIENLAGQFTFSTTVKDGFTSATESGITFLTGNLGTLQNDLKIQDEVKIYIDDTLLISGFIEDLSIAYSADSHSISIAGRDKTGDLIDSSIIQKSYSQRGFVKLIEMVLKDNGHTSISVINDVVDLSNLETNEIIKTEKGDSIATFLDRYAKKLQVLLITNEDGDLVITREGADLGIGALISEIKGYNNNILSANISVNTSERFRYIEVYSQSSNDDYTASSVNQSAIAIDAVIRDTRRKRVTMSTATKALSLNNLAKWSVNVRKAKGSRYNCKVQGFYTQRNQGALWTPNTLVQLTDDRCQVNGQFLIQGVSYSKSLQGTFTELSIVERGAFTVEGAPIADGGSFAKNLIRSADKKILISDLIKIA